MSVRHEYLGDGVYAAFEPEAGMIALRANSHTSPVVVYLEEQVMLQLIEFAERVGLINHSFRT